MHAVLGLLSHSIIDASISSKYTYMRTCLIHTTIDEIYVIPLISASVLEPLSGIFLEKHPNGVALNPNAIVPPQVVRPVALL
jgi:hypothetical protein